MMLKEIFIYTLKEGKSGVLGSPLPVSGDTSLSLLFLIISFLLSDSCLFSVVSDTAWANIETNTLNHRIMTILRSPRGVLRKKYVVSDFNGIKWGLLHNGNSEGSITQNIFTGKLTVSIDNKDYSVYADPEVEMQKDEAKIRLEKLDILRGGSSGPTEEEVNAMSVEEKAQLEAEAQERLNRLDELRAGNIEEEE